MSDTRNSRKKLARQVRSEMQSEGGDARSVAEKRFQPAPPQIPPVPPVRVARNPIGQAAALTGPQMTTFLLGMYECCKPMYVVMMATLLLTGGRVDEICNLKVDNLCLEKGNATIQTPPEIQKGPQLYYLLT